jgi:hypothetical protein
MLDSGWTRRFQQSRWLLDIRLHCPEGREEGTSDREELKQRQSQVPSFLGLNFQSTHPLTFDCTFAIWLSFQKDAFHFCFGDLKSFFFFPFFIRYLAHLHFQCYTKSPPYPPTPTPLPTHSPFLALAFPCTGAYKVCMSNGPLLPVMAD